MMRNRRSWVLAVAVVAVAALLTLGPPVRADFVVLLTSGGSQASPTNSIWYDATTNTTGSTGNGNLISATTVVPGMISLSGSLGNFSVSMTTVSGAPAIGIPGASAELDLNNISISSTGSGSLTITGYQTGDSLPAGPSSLFATFGGTFTKGMSISGSAYFDASNLGNGLVPPGSLPAFSVPTGSVAVNPIFNINAPPGFPASTPVTLTGNPFAMINQVTVTATGSNQVAGFNLDATVAPAPASLTLLFSGLPLLGLGLWVRRRKAAPMVV